MVEDGVASILDMLKLWVGQFEPYTAKACYTAGYCLFESHSSSSKSPQGSMGAMTAAFAPLNGRKTTRTDNTSCVSGSEWKCLAANKVNALRAEGGLKELAWSDTLEASSRGYAEELCRNGNTTHSNEAAMEWNGTQWLSVEEGQNQYMAPGEAGPYTGPLCSST